MGQGPLKGVKILEFAGIGPAPFCGMLLADMGADVVRLDRPGGRGPAPVDILNRGKRFLNTDLKLQEGLALARDLAAKADVLIEGFRPGVMERLGLGPEPLLSANPRLIYGRMTGWGQSGPLAQAVGHDINYIALSGALHAIGRKDQPPPPPLNLVGDFGGGALYLAMGICAALVEAKASGKGQIIDCAMTDGAASLMSMALSMRAAGWASDERDANLLDGGAPFYDTYQCADGGYIALGAIEPQFYAVLLEKLGLAGQDLPAQMDRSHWPETSDKIAVVVRTKTRAEWAALLEGSDACGAPVLSLAEAPAHPHNASRETFVVRDGVTQPNAAPRFSRTPGATGQASLADAEKILAEWS